jgi:D-alanyl-D-alanine carboxypeptidase
MLKGSQREKSYGLGIEIESDEFGKWYGHSGGIEGFEADFRYYPEHDLTIAYAVNGNQIEGEVLSDLIAQWYFGK